MLCSSMWQRPLPWKWFAIWASHPAHFWSHSISPLVNTQPEQPASMTHLGVNKLMDLWNSLSTSYGQRVMTRSLQVQQNLTKRHTFLSIPKTSSTSQMTSPWRNLQWLLISHLMKMMMRWSWSKMNLGMIIGDKDRYKDAYCSDDVAVCGIEEEGAQSDWYS